MYDERTFRTTFFAKSTFFPQKLPHTTKSHHRNITENSFDGEILVNFTKIKGKSDGPPSNIQRRERTSFLIFLANSLRKKQFFSTKPFYNHPKNTQTPQTNKNTQILHCLHFSDTLNKTTSMSADFQSVVGRQKSNEIFICSSQKRKTNKSTKHSLLLVDISSRNYERRKIKKMKYVGVRACVLT